MKVRLLYYHNNLKDSTLSSKGKTVKLEVLEDKSKMLKKILDYQVLKLQNSTLNWEISRIDLSQIINNPKPTNKEFKNSYLKTPVSDKKSELSKRTLDSQLVTSES